MEYRPRAYYSHGLIGFKNPSETDALDSVVYCPSDSMYHIGIRFSPIPGDKDHRLIRSKIREANIAHNGVEPMLEGGWADDDTVSVWYPGETDLEDMVAIAERIKEFDTRWLRPAFNELKVRCGLDESDFPYLDRDCNFINQRRPTGWYRTGWISAKGGTLVLEQYTNERILNTLQELMVQKGAVLEPVKNYHYDGKDFFSLRFLWINPLSSVYETQKEIGSIVKTAAFARQLAEMHIAHDAA